jgi:hypothetical protein
MAKVTPGKYLKKTHAEFAFFAVPGEESTRGTPSRRVAGGRRLDPIETCGQKFRAG